jgi:hypothetical protein
MAPPTCHPNRQNGISAQKIATYIGELNDTQLSEIGKTIMSSIFIDNQ